MNKEEYEKKFLDNTKYSGQGLGTTLHMPCPFCAEPDFRVFKIIETEEANSKEAVCKSCGRGSKIIYRHPAEGTTEFEVVQTCGDEPPEYLVPVMRRLLGVKEGP